ncbi:MAG: DNA-directed RNA polymerase subunit omega [bacterium]|nr:DNA-directed RNA polymerase subunit omega [bacterium]
MARVTVEDCLEVVHNRFVLVHVAARRVRQLVRGSHRLVPSKNKDVVTSLREIAAGKVQVEEDSIPTELK